MDRMTKLFATAIAIAAGMIVLLGYLIPPLLPDANLVAVTLTFLRDQMVRWAVIIAAFAFILGFFNILRVHLGRVAHGRRGALYSGVLILSAIVSLGLTLVGRLAASLESLPAATSLVTASDWWFQYVLSPLQASVTGLIAFTLALAGFRLLRKRRNVGAVLFLLSAIIVLLGTLQLPGAIGEQLVRLREWWITVPTMAGMRGLLIGVGLGTLLMGLRVITGLDRPYSDR